MGGGGGGEGGGGGGGGGERGGGGGEEKGRGRRGREGEGGGGPEDCSTNMYLAAYGMVHCIAHKQLQMVTLKTNAVITSCLVPPPPSGYHVKEDVGQT